MGRRAVLAAVGVAAVLRGLPLLAPHLAVELGTSYPKAAVLAVADGHWKPAALVHGAGLSDILRALFTAWYGLGRATGRYADPADLVAAFARDPFPYVVAGRLVIVAASLLAVWLTAGVARRLGGPLAAPAAALVLATCFIHVRESTHVWPDALAATAAIATVGVALRQLQRGTLAGAAWLGVVAGLSLACKHALAPLALPVAIAILAGGRASFGARLGHLAVASACAAAAYLASSPYSVIEWAELQAQMAMQAMFTLTVPPESRLPWSRSIMIAFGPGGLALAIAGIATALARAPLRALVVAAFPIVYCALLIRGGLFVRYFADAAPLVAVLAGTGAAAVAARVVPRHRMLATMALTVLACAGPAWRSWSYVRLLGRPDTRIEAGAWLVQHVPPGTAVTLPSPADYSNPVVTPDVGLLHQWFPSWYQALQARGVADPQQTFRLHWQGGYLASWDTKFAPKDAVVVTTSHPSSMVLLVTPPANVERLEAAGYRVGARFEAVSEPAPAGVVYDPLEADYAPVLGAGSVPRYGPNITIWLSPRFTPREP